MSITINPLPNGAVIIQTARLLLSAAQPSDAEDLYLYFSDPEVMRYWSTPPHQSIEETRDRRLPKMVKSKETNGITDFVLVLLREGDGDGDDDGDYLALQQLPENNTTTGPSIPRNSDLSPPAVIGKIGIFSPLTLLDSDSDSPTQSGELGFLLARTYHRRGLVSEALTALLPYLFNPWGVDAMTTDVDPRNRASIGFLEKHGFVLTGRKERTWEVGGVWVDSEYWTLTGRGWGSWRRGGRRGEGA